MSRKIFLSIALAIFCFSVVAPGLAAEKLTYSSSVKVYAGYYLPILAAEEKGFWKANDLEVEWIAFAGTVPQMHAVTTGANNIGMGAGVSPIQMAERGVPVAIVGELVPYDPFLIWVRTDSPYRQPRDLKAARVGVTTLGGPTHAYGRIMAAAQGIDKEVRFVGAGGVPEQMAGIRAGAFDAIILPVSVMAVLKVQGVVREIASMADYLPKPWPDHVIFARRDYARSKPEVARRTLKATLQGIDFLKKNPRWALDKMKSFQGLSEEAAKLLYDNIQFTTTGKLDRKAAENLRNIFIEYGILTKEKTPAVDDLFTNEYLP